MGLWKISPNQSIPDKAPQTTHKESANIRNRPIAYKKIKGLGFETAGS